MNLEKPRLRPFLTVVPDPTNPGFVFVWDDLGLTPTPYRFSREEYLWFQMFDGQRTIQSLHQEATRLGDGQIGISYLETLVQRLEEALFLDGPRFRRLVENPIREPRCIGCYPGNPSALRRTLHRLFTGRKGPGLPANKYPDGRLKAAIIPHIDYPRGGTTYAWGFKEVAERTDALLFVIIGTSHYSQERFTLTRKHFKTPLGVVQTDQNYIDRLENLYGPGLFADELVAHLPEHSIELEVVFLQYLFENRQPIRIVPLVVGSFHDAVRTNKSPQLFSDIGRMIKAMQQIEEESKEPICYIISGDLAHIGPKFGDSQLVSPAQLDHCEKQDIQLMQQAEAVDLQGYFQTIVGEKDDRRICGFPPTFTTLQAVRPSFGKVLHYNQYVHPQGHETVSFASVAFYK